MENVAFCFCRCCSVEGVPRLLTFAQLKDKVFVEFFLFVQSHKTCIASHRLHCAYTFYGILFTYLYETCARLLMGGIAHHIIVFCPFVAVFVLHLRNIGGIAISTFPSPIQTWFQFYQRPIIVISLIFFFFY